MAYSDTITEATGYQNPDDVAAIENCMRDIIFHSTLDWQDRDTLKRGAIEAVDVLVAMGDLHRRKVDDTKPVLIAVVPDPDYFDGKDRKEVYADTPDELVKAVREWITETGYGSRAIGAMFNVYQDGKFVASVRYNGRFDWRDNA